jgi:hypothetical protein
MTHSQNEKILAHLKSGKTITSLQAIREFGITRLSARVHFLKHDLNIPVQSKTIKVDTRDGKLVRVAQYYLTPEVINQLKSA